MVFIVIIFFIMLFFYMRAMSLYSNSIVIFLYWSVLNIKLKKNTMKGLSWNKNNN